MAGTFHLSVITPERAVLETEATAVGFPAWDGEVGVLPQRAPFLFEMGIGNLKVEFPEGKQTLYVDGGFAQMVGDKLTLLTEQDKRLDELDRGKAEAALVAARELSILSDAGFEGRQKAIQGAEVQKQTGELAARAF